jgi:ribosomal protein S27E
MNKESDLPISYYVTCRCQHCGNGIEFDASDFSEGEKRNVECPHCHTETIIFVPFLVENPVTWPWALAA